MAADTVSESKPALERPGLRGVLDQLTDARCVLQCGLRALELAHDDSADEQVCIRHGLLMLERAYDSLDRAIGGGAA